MVLDAPTLMTDAPDDLGGTGVEFLGGQPTPGSVLGLAAPLSAHLLDLQPVLFGHDHPHGAAHLGEAQVLDLPQVDGSVFPLPALGRLRLRQGRGLLVDLEALLLEDGDHAPAQFLHRPEEGTLGVPGIHSDGVEKARAIETAHPAQ